MVTRFWQTANAADWEGFAALLDPALVYEPPARATPVVKRD